MNEEERYFLYLDSKDEVLSVFRLVNTKDVFAEEKWTNNEWQPTERLVKYLIDGENALVEVSYEEAQKHLKKTDVKEPNAS